MYLRSTGSLGIFVAILTMGCSFKGMLTPMHLEDCRGDGSISRIKYLPNPGVMVEFAPFPLTRPFRATYQLDGLPRRPFPYMLTLVVPYPDDYKVSEQHELFRVPGTLELTLWAEEGTALFRCEGTPSWSGVFGGTFSNAEAGFSKCDGARGDKPYILPEDLESEAHPRFRLDVSWSPEDGTPDVNGRIELRSGGST